MKKAATWGKKEGGQWDNSLHSQAVFIYSPLRSQLLPPSLWELDETKEKSLSTLPIPWFWKDVCDIQAWVANLLQSGELPWALPCSESKEGSLVCALCCYLTVVNLCMSAPLTISVVDHFSSVCKLLSAWFIFSFVSLVIIITYSTTSS